MYSLALRSRQLIARAFRRRVTDEVIPSIRKTVLDRTGPDKDKHPTTCPPATPLAHLK
jgi:prophage antirepressor-like protein